MKQETEIHLEQRGDLSILDIQGDVTAFSESFFNDAYVSANENGASKILLKFTHDAYINSGGIAILIQLIAKAKRNQQQICIAGLSDHFKKIFKMVGITKFAQIYNTVEEAVNSM